MSIGNEIEITAIPNSEDDRVSLLEKRIDVLERRLSLLVAGLRCAVADGQTAHN